jgi:hypothetical protein
MFVVEKGRRYWTAVFEKQMTNNTAKLVTYPGVVDKFPAFFFWIIQFEIRTMDQLSSKASADEPREPFPLYPRAGYDISFCKYIKNVLFRILFYFLSIWFYSPLDLGRFFSFLILYAVGRILWTGDQPVARPLPAHRTTQKQNKRIQTSIPLVGFEPTTPVFERAKTFHAWDRTGTVIGIFRIESQLYTDLCEHCFIYDYDLCSGQKWIDNFVSFTIPYSSSRLTGLKKRRKKLDIFVVDMFF